MSKYEGLTYRLAKSGLSMIALTFKEAEVLIGAALPKSDRRPPFWANSNKPEHSRHGNKAAHKAGYRSVLLAGQDKVRFVRD
ncbi:hypothetical protein N181_01790 [Sinorhizobium fredii USDA 205]|uniref:Uncharacterized protein n=1 Tax=Rhizobium fredii TaxID=380 RepID=A0A844AIX6_RHIFR|nr:hypothetical protein [Sinorhizobium fredii]KSV87358.1 hypothetical protein N181_01790 [Sinorhizobium fredii USDA 205]MQX11795.1 hypothetical protein [Sinorhizobium fredii]GEC31697.1 hypothetical protein EFR01_18680 [Sinorhizobium fredii]GLS09020.1 hypothetical protein GCM10007864_26500 [Sinorhizobium fredii]